MIDISADIRALADRYLEKVKPSGPSNIMAICPFHRRADGTSERKGSFAMNLVNGLYFCHSCQSKGNLLTFLKSLGLSRGVIDQRYKFLLEAAARNVPPPGNPLKSGVFKPGGMDEALLGLFDYTPSELLVAGFTKETLAYFDVGYDRWHERITYPLRGLGGNLLGISGRTIGMPWMKYKVYTTEYATWGLPNQLEPDRRLILWNADKVYPVTYFTGNHGGIAVVEGFKACMWVWQAGIKNVVALLGTYMSWEHQWILERIGGPINLFLDNNSPGRTGAINAAERLSKSTKVNIVEYPPRLQDEVAAQPDSCTPEEVLQQLEKPVPYLSWLLKHA